MTHTRDYDFPSHSSRDDNDDDEDEDEDENFSCFKSPKNWVCYSSWYVYTYIGT